MRAMRAGIWMVLSCVASACTEVHAVHDADVMSDRDDINSVTGDAWPDDASFDATIERDFTEDAGSSEEAAGIFDEGPELRFEAGTLDLAPEDVVRDARSDARADLPTWSEPIYATEPVLARHVMVGNWTVFVTARDGTFWGWGESGGLLQPSELPARSEIRGRPQRIMGVVDVREIQIRSGGFCVIAGPEEEGALYCWGVESFEFYGAFWGDSWDEWRYPHRMGSMTGIRSFTQTGGVVRSDNSEWAWSGHAGTAWRMYPGWAGMILKEAGGALWVTSGLTRPGDEFARIYAEGVYAIPGIVDIVGGEEHSCALTRSGQVFCWGTNEFGQAGNFDLGGHCGARAPDEGYCVRTPTAIPGIDDAVKIASSLTTVCVIRRGGTVWCWGLNDLLRDGLGSIGDGRPPGETCGYSPWPGPVYCARRPVQVAGLRDAVDISVGVPVACAVVASGETYCWGSNRGALGDGTADDRSTPTLVRW